MAVNKMPKRRRDADEPAEELVPATIRFPAILRKRALGVAADEDRTFASLVIYALRRYVEAAERSATEFPLRPRSMEQEK